MASIDLRDAYYTIPVHLEYRKYFTCLLGRHYFEFTCLPNGYAQAPLIFTKILKLPFAYLRKLGHPSVVYIDASYLQGNTASDCADNIFHTVHLLHLLQSLGFTIHPKKSIMTPTQHIEFLGFKLDSLNMTISVTEEKGKIKEVCEKLLTNRVHAIRFLAGVVGTLVAALPGITWRPLHYRALERCKDHAFHLSKGVFDTPVMLSSDAVSDLVMDLQYPCGKQFYPPSPN